MGQDISGPQKAKYEFRVTHNLDFIYVYHKFSNNKHKHFKLLKEI